MGHADQPAIEINNLTRFFGSFKALNDISLVVHPGETLAIFGHNGAGKTTLLKILSTVMKPSNGEVFFNGRNIALESETVRRDLGIVSHRSFLYLNLTAYDNLAFYGRLYNIDNRSQRIKELLERLNLKTRMHDKVSTFSRGMQQRLAIARALLHRPGIVLLDEPESGLDIKALDTLWQLLKEEDRTIVFTHHSLERGFATSSRVAVLSRGKIAYCPENKGSFSELHQAYSLSLEAM